MFRKKGAKVASDVDMTELESKLKKLKKQVCILRVFILKITFKLNMNHIICKFVVIFIFINIQFVLLCLFCVFIFFQCKLVISI